jgi:phosphoribosylformimino-5-aminoimidazole carboxamide ribotide isomerase
MRVIGVIDLLGGRAVHARGGQREAYAPVVSVAGVAVDGDALAVARRYLELGVPELYVADLDAIGGAPRQDDLIRSLLALGAPVWLDAGGATASAARDGLLVESSRLVVGLETLDSWESIAAVARVAGTARTVFSLDLRDGVPLRMAADDPVALAELGVRAGAGTVIVLDLARVGSGRGVDFDLLARVREALPDVELVAAGGVRDETDLEFLATAGCTAALVATALHTHQIRNGVGSHFSRTVR